MAVKVDLLAGALVGSYRILHEHSKGGMGTVYAGEHIELGKRVAIKVLHARVCEKPSAIERFLREARTASQIGHPNVVDVFDLGRCDDGRPFMVMPLLEGIDCEQALAERGPRAPAVVAQWLAGAAEGLDALHRRGLVHRDVKPANIFLRQRDDGTEESVIMDFGLAAFQREGSRLTAKGMVLGTPHYLPPECATGTKTDVPGDVYSLAVVAFEMITGQLPFDHEDPAYVLAAKLSNIAPALSSRVNGDVPEELDELFRRALSRRPAKRPPSCTEFIAALESMAPQEPLAPATSLRQRDIDTDEMPSSPSEPATNHPTKSSVQLPTRRGGLVLVFSLLGLAIAGGIWASGSSEVASIQQVGGDADGGIQEPESAASSELEGGFEPASSTTATTLATRQPSRPRTDRRHESMEPIGSMESIEQVAEVEPIESIESIESMESVEQPVEQLEVASTEPTPSVPADNARLAERLTREANRLSLRGLLPAAIAKYREATLASPDHAAAWRGLGIANERMNRAAEARRAFQRYLRVAPNAADAARIQHRLASL